MSEIFSNDIAASLKKVAKSWKKAKRQADRDDHVSQRSLNYLRYSPPKTTIREAAFQVMAEAYNKASSNGKYYANARQIMYAARPLILKLLDDENDIWKNDNYFTQTLLKDYLEQYNNNWKVVWDSRGHITEPHTNKVIGLGGAEVNKYKHEWISNFTKFPKYSSNLDIKTVGPTNRFHSVLFIEKEGFDVILKDAEIDKKFDLAIMSTKGLPVKAACDLVQFCYNENVKVFVLHDFDLAGFKIVKTLREGTRLSYGSPVIDIGLRLEDVTNLESEPVSYNQSKDPRYYLHECGATDEECDFLVGSRYYRSWSGKRVELNALTSDELIEWLESKFEEHGISKLIPDTEILKDAYQRAIFLQEVDKESEKIKEQIIENLELEIPDNLNELVQESFDEDPSISWDEAICNIVEENINNEDSLDEENESDNKNIEND